MFKSGETVSEHIEPVEDRLLKNEEIETHGVELGIDKIFILKGIAKIGNDTYETPNYVEVKPKRDGVYKLEAGSYVVQYDKQITIPDSCVGFVYPRSRLMRSGIQLSTAVWESGYSGIGQGGLNVTRLSMLDDDLRIGQIVFADAQVESKYDGYHQGENIESGI